MVVFWLVVLKIFYFSIQLGISSSQLTNSIIFHRGRLKPPSSFTTVYMSLYDVIVIWIQCCETWGFKSQKNLKYFQDGSRMMLSREFPAVQLFNLFGGVAIAGNLHFVTGKTRHDDYGYERIKKYGWPLHQQWQFSLGCSNLWYVSESHNMIWYDREMLGMKTFVVKKMHPGSGCQSMYLPAIFFLLGCQPFDEGGSLTEHRQHKLNLRAQELLLIIKVHPPKSSNLGRWLKKC